LSVTLKIFRISLLVGFAVNMVFALPALIVPRFLETLFDVGATDTTVWLRNVGILLVIISTMYLAVFQDAFRYIFIAYLALAGRFAAGCFFLILVLFADYPSGFRILAANDLILSSLQAILLYRVLREGPARPLGVIGS
jgi:hypothetical protein